MHLRSAILLLPCLGLMQLTAQDPAVAKPPDELIQLRRQFEIQALTRAKLLSEQFANALATIAREAGAEGDYEQALAAQRRRDQLVSLYSQSLDETALTNVILLKPGDARVNGAVNYDRNANALVSWKTAGSIATWDVSRLTPGSYEVTLTYAVAEMGDAGRVNPFGVASDMSTGGEFEFYEDSSLTGADQNRRIGTVASTGGWTEWSTLTLTPIQITRPSARFALKITKTRGTGGVMHLRGIRLAPTTSVAGTAVPGGVTPDGDQAPADEFAALQQTYVDHLRGAITPVVDAFTENLKTLAAKHAESDPDAANDYTAEAKRAEQQLSDPQTILSGPSKGSRQVSTPEGFRELRDATYVPNPRNTGDRFKVNQGGEEFFVRLLWVSCPSPGSADEKQLKDHAGYFGISLEDAQAVAKEAQAFTARSLTGKSLTLLTRGSKDEEDNLLVGVRHGRVGEFAGVLVDHGLAMIRTPSVKKGPARQHEEAILRNLSEREQAAKTRPIPPGAWARSAGQ